MPEVDVLCFKNGRSGKSQLAVGCFQRRGFLIHQNFIRVGNLSTWLNCFSLRRES